MVTAYADGYDRPALRPPHDPRGNPSRKPRQKRIRAIGYITLHPPHYTCKGQERQQVFELPVLQEELLWVAYAPRRAL